MAGPDPADGSTRDAALAADALFPPDAGVFDAAPAAMFKSYITLGDSISARGGAAPFFYDLLAANDDALYPAYAGKDLKSLYGPDFKVYRRAVGGSVSSDLLKQIDGLPANVELPAIVTMTIGGNDIQRAFVRILSGTDSADRVAFQQNLESAYRALKLKVPGAKVYEATIYDPGDGVGDYSRCPPPRNQIPRVNSAVLFAPWNAVVRTVVAAAGATEVDVYSAFIGHALAAPSQNWFALDCIHSSRIGHHELRRLFFDSIRPQ